MTTDLVKIPKCEISKTGLQFTQDITFAEWKDIGSGLKEIEGCIQFWVGDWLNYGKQKYERGKYDKALQELGYEYQTLRVDSYVAENVDTYQRNENLSFSHHREVASLQPIEQIAWLDKAETEHLPVRELRKQIKESRKPEIEPLPSDKYKVVYADPPWSYGDKLIEGYGTAEHHYQTMSIEELYSINITDIVENDVVELLYEIGLPIISYSSKEFQQLIGENKAGIEIKFDQKFRDTGNLYIEIAEKSNPNNLNFVPSGMYRNDNTWLYIIGDEKTIFIFSKKLLVQLHKTKKYKEVQTETSKGYLLPLQDADKYSVKIINKEIKA